MRFISNLLLFAGMILAVLAFFITAEYYDFVHDNFVFIHDKDFYQKVETAEEHKLHENSTEKFDEISFSNVFDTNLGYYRIAGYFAVFGFIFGMCVMFFIITKGNTRTVYDSLKESDDFLIFLNSTIIIGILLLFVQLFVYNKVFLNNNDVVNKKVVESSSITVITNK